MLDLTERLHRAAAVGMTASVWAQEKPDATAIHDAHGKRGFFEVNANANRLVRLLRALGFQPGDSVALMCGNRAEFVEVLCATLRGGFRFTPVNWHLTAEEVEYIINDCEAKALIAEPRYPAALSAQAPGVSLKLAIGAPADGFLSYEDTLRQFDGSDIDDPLLGGAMLYTSAPPAAPRASTAATPLSWCCRPPARQTTCRCAPGPPITPRRWPSTCARRSTRAIPWSS
jgi:long-chain acyl-CoA synthetase